MSIYLITPNDIELALQRTTCGNDSTAVEKAAGLLLMAHTRLATTLGIDSFEKGVRTDIFETFEDDAQVIRLVDGFVDPTAPVTIAAIGDTTGRTFDKLLPELGHITLDKLRAGRYSVTYTAGFEKDDKNIAKDVPEWLQGICITMVLHWMRIGLLNPRVPESASYTAIIDNAIREILGRVYMRYDRLHAGVVFAERGIYGSGN